MIPWVFLLLGVLVAGYPAVTAAQQKRLNSSEISTFRAQQLTAAQLKAERASRDDYQKSLEDGRFASGPDPFSSGGGSGNNYVAAGKLLFVLHIPKLQLSLPVYYGTSDVVLARGVGLLENTSFPGAKGHHAVIAGHRGMHDKDVFLHLDDLHDGDPIYVEEHDRVLKYTMRESVIVAPTDTSRLRLEPGHDLITLLTCDPYPINTNRMLVRTERARITAAEIAAINPALVPASEADAQTPGQQAVTWQRHWWSDVRVLVPVGLLACSLVVFLLVWRHRRHTKGHPKG